MLALLLAPAARADTSEDWTIIEQRLSTRQEVLQGQTKQAEHKAQEQALATYRLQRRRELGFFTTPESRAQDAQSSDLAIASLQRRHIEKRTLSAELERVRAELHKLRQARQVQESARGVEDAGLKLLRPVKGVVVGEPGIRHESPTSTEIRRDGMEFLARLNEPVRAVETGVVRIVELLPQGGYAVVTQHPQGWISIVSGLRDVLVRPGEPVAQGQSVGLAGRNLDGAAVISLELWRDRKPVEPRGRITFLAKVR
jgi:septal ring factor EnvC (AmiA/AmiB activator)